jgi:hypothetical protein
MNNSVAPVTVVNEAAISLLDGQDASTAKELLKRFNDAQLGMRRVVSLGLFAWEVKEKKLKHGQFGKWLAAHCPKLVRIREKSGTPQPTEALDTYMRLTKGVLQGMGFTIEKYLAHISIPVLDGKCHGGKFLLLPDKKLNPEVKALKEKFCTLVDGKTQRQLCLEFKQVEQKDNGEVKVKRGQLKGKGGASKEQRAASAERDEQDRIEAVELDCDDIIKLIEKHCDAKGFGSINKSLRKKLAASLAMASGFIRHMEDGQ